MRFLILAGLAMCLLVSFGVVALDGGEDRLVPALEAAGCEDIDYRYETRDEVEWLSIAVGTCRDGSGRALGQAEVSAVVDVVAPAAADFCYDALAVWHRSRAPTGAAPSPGVTSSAAELLDTEKACGEGDTQQDRGSQLALATALPLMAIVGSILVGAVRAASRSGSLVLISH